MTLKIFNALKEKALLNRSEAVSSRVERLAKLQKWIKDNESQIEDAIYQDFKKPKFETQVTEILLVQSELKYFIQKLPRWMKERKVSTPIGLAGHISRIRYENKGVVLIISPWNYPFQLTVMPLLAALAAGNTVIIKPSELTGHTSTLLERMCQECFSENEVILEQGEKEKTNELLAYSVDHVFFTGSTLVGKIIAKSCAERLIPYTLELGGKSPTIIDNTINVKEAVKKIFWGKFANRGQACVAPDVLIIHQSIKVQFMTEYQKYSDQFKDENPTEIINKNHAARLKSMAHIDFSTMHTLLVEADTATSEKLKTEEIFGPIALVYTYETLQDIEKIYNISPNPLALYIFSDDKNFVETILNKFPSGGVGINTLIVHLANHNLPFGGIGTSGQGRYHGYFGFLELSHQRAILEKNLPNSSLDLIYPPYSAAKATFIQILKKIVT
ncbi:MAG: aldehyde dehydrogenase family protein [Bdellovibrionaceae bacterium]|nr:aldehyde dehydrogenase family protein [Pseudobdellovibrionaceae bacterium]